MKKLWVIPVIGMMCASGALAETNVLEKGSTVSIRVNADRGGVIQNAFTAVFFAAGFNIDSSNSGYLLDVTISIEPLNISNNPNMEFVRFDLTANLLDANGRIVLPYSMSWREGHFRQAGAEDRAFRNAVTKINDEYGNLLKGYAE